MKLTLRQIEVFATIARTGTVSRAATELAMSQSAASSALLELERLYDCPLFDRIGKSLHLNPAGKALIPLAEGLLAQAMDIESSLNGQSPSPLSVAATLTIGNYLATLIIADYLRDTPGAPVTLHVANTDAVVNQLLRFECDIGLIEGDVSHPDLLIEPWMSDELVVFCAPTHAMANAGPMTNEQLATATWILRERGSGTRGQFDREIGSQLPQLQVMLELEHTEGIKRMVESGVGISCLSRLALRDAFRRGSLVEIQTPQFHLQRRFFFAQHRQRQHTLSVDRLRTYCLALGDSSTSTRDLALPFVA